jgi:hypothetical protein
LIGTALTASVSGLTGYATTDQTVGGQPLRRHFFLAGASLDYFGAITDVPMSYTIYNVPFLTTGAASPTAIIGDSFSVLTLTPYFGVHCWGDQNGTDPYAYNSYRLQAQRLDPATLAPIAGATWIGAGPGNPTAPNGTLVSGGAGLPFQHCAVAQAGWAHMDTTEGTLNTTRFYCTIGGFWKRTAFGDDVDHWFGLSIPWSGSVVPTKVKAGYAAAGGAGGLATVNAASKAALLAATVTTWWQDTAANRIYVKVFVPWSTSQGGPGGDQAHITVDA